MAIAVWPADLPQEVLFDGYKERPAKVLLRTPMDAGPAKVRRRTTAGIRNIQFVVEMTRAQAVIFETWYRDILKDGSLAFEWVHPRTQASCIYRFTDNGYDISLVTGALCHVACYLEILP